MSVDAYSVLDQSSPVRTEESLPIEQLDTWLKAELPDVFSDVSGT